MSTILSVELINFPLNKRITKLKVGVYSHAVGKPLLEVILGK